MNRVFTSDNISFLTTGSTTLTIGTPSPHMCNVQVTEILVNTTNTQTELSIGGDDDDGSVDLDSFGIPF